MRQNGMVGSKARFPLALAFPPDGQGPAEDNIPELPGNYSQTRFFLVRLTGILYDSSYSLPICRARVVRAGSTAGKQALFKKPA